MRRDDCGSRSESPPPGAASTESSLQKQEADHCPIVAPHEWKQRGNEAFKRKDFVKASEMYHEGIVSCRSGRAGNDDDELLSHLHSNLVVALIRLERFDEAQAHCNIVLNELKSRTPKILFRRALSRQGQAKEECCQRRANALLQLARHDLLQAQIALQHSEATYPRASMLQAIERTMQQLDESLTEIQLHRQTSASLPDADLQKRCILQLLRSSLQVKGSAAFFLIDWKWWCSWCSFVLSGTSEITALLPKGARPPDEDATSRSEAPGSIDNSKLLLPRTPFHIQFFRHYDGNPRLRPNLVRGYHYELLPREAYFALISWYGEVSPSVCRRISGSLKIVMYPLAQAQDIPKPHSRCGACQSPFTNSRCTRCDTSYCDRSCQESHWQFHQRECPDNINRERWPVGLNNLGNTCFMNAALQALSHAMPLTRYFLSLRYVQELNRSNPLGTGGRLAAAYNEVLRDLWMRRATSTSPISLKRVVGVFAPRFDGYLQHDAQEFLAYLLDGLHEDLNRVENAPYVKVPAVDMKENMAVAGARAWDAYRSRNDSIVLDTFYGLFRSTCVCPRCERVSVSFDAFNHVSLEIPRTQESSQVFYSVLFFPRNSSGGQSDSHLPVRYGVELPRHCLVRQLKDGLSALLDNVPPSHIALCEVQDHAIVGICGDDMTLDSPEVCRFGFEVEPASPDCIFVVARHELVADDAENNSTKSLSSYRIRMGFPFITTLSGTVTCRQAWESLWKVVAPRVEPGHCSNLEIFATPNGNPDSIIYGELHHISRDCDEPLIASLGEGSTGSLAHIILEWNGRGTSEMNGDSEPMIREERFVAYKNHSSWVAAVERDEQPSSAAPMGVTLDHCLEAFIRPERLDECNAWYCSHCKEHVRALKTMELWRLPNILVFQLKRFQNRNVLRREKLDVAVDFPAGSLDMSKHSPEGDGNSLLDSSAPAVYDLFSVINHHGRMGFGHYTALARKWDEVSLSSEWTLFDDSSARVVGDNSGWFERAVSRTAYVLFYRRRIFH